MTTEKNNNQYMTFEELAGFLLNYNQTQSMGRNKELSDVYTILLGYSGRIPEISDTDWEHDRKLREIFSKIKVAKSDTENPKAKEFLDYATIVIGTRLAKDSTFTSLQYIKPEPIDMLRVFMKQIDNIKSNQVKYDSLKFLSGQNNRFGANITHQILVKIAENPLATTDDLYKLQQSYEKANPMRKKIFAEIEAKTKALIEEEMKKILPDVRRVRNAIATLINSAQETGDMKLENEVRTTYNADEILNPESGKEYVAKIEESKTEKIAQLQQKVAGLEAEVDQQTRKLLDAQRGWNQTTEALKQLQIEKEAQKEEMETKLAKSKRSTQQLIDATEQLQIGIGSRGIKKMRETVEQIERERRKKEY